MIKFWTSSTIHISTQRDHFLVISRKEIKGLCFYNQVNTQGNCIVLKCSSFCMMSLSFFCLLQIMQFLPSSSLHSLRDTSFLSVSYSDWHVYSLYLFSRRYNPTGLRRMCQLDYLNLWRYLWRQSLILSFLMLETEMKDNRMKRSSHNALLRIQHHRITIHITDTVDGLRKKQTKKTFSEQSDMGYYIQFFH